MSRAEQAKRWLAGAVMVVAWVATMANSKDELVEEYGHEVLSSEGAIDVTLGALMYDDDGTYSWTHCLPGIKVSTPVQRIAIHRSDGNAVAEAECAAGDDCLDAVVDWGLEEACRVKHGYEPNDAGQWEHSADAGVSTAVDPRVTCVVWEDYATGGDHKQCNDIFKAVAVTADGARSNVEYKQEYYIYSFDDGGGDWGCSVSGATFF